MVGPGTGIAPFRAFMQERESSRASGKNWLFFGEWNRKYDFYYEDYWNKLQKELKMRYDVAFSRDQDHKIYVQDIMKKHGEEIWNWLRDGAFIYVCGDASKMAKDVEHTLLEIIQIYGDLSESESKNYLKKMRQEKRYQKDVY